MKQTWLNFGIILSLFIMVIGCSKEKQLDHVNTDNDDGHDIEETKPNEQSAAITYFPYAKEVGFSLHRPKEEKIEANTVVTIEGSIEHLNDLHENTIWVVIEKYEPIEGLEIDDFHYYIELENGGFSKQLVMHHGSGEYKVSVRIPSNKSGEAEMYYDAATFTVMNTDQDIQREVAYTKHGVQEHIQLTSPTLGISDPKGSIYIEGTVPENHAGEIVLVQVEKDGENKQIIFPIKGNSFSGDVPLFFGEGMHMIRVQTYSEAEDVYYESANFYANNQTAVDFAAFETNSEYIERGITLYEPSITTEATQDKREYRIAGKIDRTVAGADAISYLIVTVNYLDEQKESGYLIPVKDYQFDGTAYFRFGPGKYEVVINVPDTEQHDQSMFYYKGIAKINHQVVDIKDERELLPSRGIESDHPTIVKKAEQLTAGVTNDRDKAKAVFRFVAEHVAYDVQKAENDIFNIGDSALSTLESGKGICQDYAFLAIALLRAVGLESHFVEGDAGERHAWVEVKVDGKWLEMDPTWGAGYIQDGVFHFHYNEDYFDPEPAFLAETHTREGIMY